MDKDRIKGTVNDAVGRAKRQVGEWTGDENAQAEGAADQAKGKAQNAWGKVKDAGRDIADDLKKHDNKDEDRKYSRPPYSKPVPAAQEDAENGGKHSSARGSQKHGPGEQYQQQYIGDLLPGALPIHKMEQN